MTYLFTLLCLQLTCAKESRTVSMQGVSTEVGKHTDLTRAEIKYEKQVEVGSTNTVTVETNPPVTNAIIYMNVTNECELDYYSYCVQGASAHNFLKNGMNLKLKHKGKGVYEGKYTITSDQTGGVSLTFYTMKHGLDAQVYENRDFIGKPVKKVHSDTINYDWGKGEIFGVKKDFVGVRWRGKWIFPETRTYDFQFRVDDIIRFYLDGQLKVQTSYVDSPKGYKKDFRIQADKGEHDFVLEYIENADKAKAGILWKHPAGYKLVPIPKDYFRSIDTVVVSDLIEVTCLKDHYLNKAQKRCVMCPTGTCQSKLGQTSCHKC